MAVTAADGHLTNDDATGLGAKLDNGFARGRYTSASPAYFAPPSKITPPSIRSHPCFAHANSGPTKPGGELDSRRGVDPEDPVIGQQPTVCTSDT